MKQLFASLTLLVLLAIGVSLPPPADDAQCVPEFHTHVAALDTPMVLTGCSSLGPKREAAVTNIARDKVFCIANMVGRPAQEILDKCAKNVTGDDLKNITDLIFGMKEGAAAYGAKIPDAPPPGSYLPRDAGAQ